MFRVDSANPSMPALALAVLVSAAPASAPAAPPPEFGEPEVLKLDWNTRCPRVADFNGDGLADIAVLNLDRARIDIFLQKPGGPVEGEPEKRSDTTRWNPVLEISRFERHSLVVGQPMYALVTGDWNGDGRPDLAYTTDDGNLVLRMQGENINDWSAKRTFQLDTVSGDSDSLLATDLNGNGKTDLVVLTETRILVIHQTADGWAEPVAHALSDKDANMPQAADLDGDGLTDLFLTTGDGARLLARPQQKDGGFGREWVLEVPNPGTWVQSVRLNAGTGLAWLQDNTSVTHLARLESIPNAAEADTAATMRYAMPPADTRTGAAAAGDVNGDGIPDVVLAEPKAARVWVFLGLKGGGYSGGREFPSLSGVEALAIADVDGDGKADLVVCSPSEKTVGVAQWSRNRFSYPETIYQSPDPLPAMCAGEFQGGPAVVCVQEAKPKPELVVLRLEGKGAGKKGKSWRDTRIPLQDGPAKVNAMRLVDADQDGNADLALFSALSPMQILLARAAGEPLVKVTGLPDSLTAKQTPGALATGDLDGDGKAELILCKDQFARAFTAAPDGKARMVEQFNAPAAGARLVAVVVAPTEKGGPLVRMLDTKEDKIHELARGEDGVFRTTLSRPLGGANPEETVLSPDHTSLLLLNRDRFEVLPLSGPSLALKPLASFDSELKDTSPSDLIVAPFSGGKVDDIVLLDNTRSRVLEFFRAAPGSDHAWSSVLYFPVFQADPHYRGKKGYENEPHDYTTADINGDGLPDICLLVHDRLLIYPSQPVTKAAAR